MKFTRKAIPTLVMRLVCLAVLLVPVAWLFGQNVVQSYTDFFIQGVRTPLDAMYAWNATNFGSNAGAEIWRLFPIGIYFYLCNNLFHFPNGLALLLLLTGLLVLAYVYFVRFLRLFFDIERADTSFRLGALIFIFNPYTVTQLSDSFLTLIPYLVLPLQAYLFMRAIKYKHELVRMALLLALVNAAVFGINLIFDVISIGLIVILGLWLCAVEKQAKLRTMIQVLGVTGAVTLALISFWLVPQIYSSLIDQTTTQAVLQSEDFYNLDSSVVKVLRGFGAWGFFSGNNGIPYNEYAAAYASNFFVIVIGYYLPVFAFLPLLLKKASGQHDSMA